MNIDALHATDDEQWMPVSDLMALLMLIFMFIAIIFVRTVVDQEKVFQEECDKIYRVLEAEFEDDFVNWKVELLEDLTIRFKNPEVLFLAGSDEIRPYFQRILSVFFPRYMRVVIPYQNDIREIRIEGHTSSEWVGATDEEDAYFRNMELSHDRTRAILQYVLSLPESGDYENWARPRMTANGLSSSKLLDSSGQPLGAGGAEDRNLSRRVEFRLLTSSCQKAGIYED